VNFPQLSPLIQQTFFIGNGRTSSGAVQTFHVPAGATRLYLGFADAVSFVGTPCCYGDNSGSLTATAGLFTQITGTLMVPGTANIFSSGYPVAGNGQLPIEYSLTDCA
jgi:hypothetical protein